MGVAPQYESHIRRSATTRLHDQGWSARLADGPPTPRRQTRGRVTRLPEMVSVRHHDAHRLLPSQYRVAGDEALTQIAEDPSHLADLLALTEATDDRLLAEHELLPGIGVHEL